MTESIKLAELHRTNIEYERQRHLANWLIKSGPHMNKAPSTASQINANPAPIYFVGKSNAASQHVVATLASNGGTVTATANGGTANAGTGAMGLSRSTLFNSQTNLPLQILTAQDGHKPKLRRFNSHDTSANMFSVADFENARLARRNEMEIKQRQQNRYKMNSLSSGTGDCSTGDSKGSKFSSDSFTELLQADVFLDRFSLPRVVRVSTKFGTGDETIQSSSSHETFSSSGASSSLVGLTKRDTTDYSGSGELFLLFRQMKNRHIYHGVSAKNGASRKKGFMIPQEFQGYFSMINEKGTTSAMQYTTLVQLVRERVYKFLSVDNLPAYTETQNTDTYPPRPHYVKGTTRGGQVFRLLAVFEDGKQDTTNGHQPPATGKSTSTASGQNTFREKEKGRYAQLLNENRQVVYVSLTTKGKFYEIEKSTPQIFTKTNSTDSNSLAGRNSQPKPPNPDCVHRISQLLVDAQVDLPITIRYIGGPQGSTSVIPETLAITKITTENVVIACPIEDVEARSPLHLRKLQVAPELQFIKSILGFENEQKMFLSQNVQNILKFCQLNVDSFLRMIELEHLAPITKHNTYNGTKSKGEGLKILKPLNFPRLLRREKSTIAHEKEDSIIFLSKNDLENLDNKAKDPTEKMKVFQPTKKKWFRKSSSKTASGSTVVPMDIDAQTKRMSMDRFQDMSKLLHERFGDDNEQFVVLKPSSTNGVRPSSEIGVNPSAISSIDQAELRQKSMSMQDMDTRSTTSYNRPDLVPVEADVESEINAEQSQEASDLEDRSLISFSNQQSFISEKLFNEFHVKTKQHSKSSSHLHNLLHFSVPQKMNISETPRKKIQFDETASKQTSSPPYLDGTTTTTIEDEMPYSSVRDSLVVEASNASSDGASSDRPTPYATTQIGASRSLDFVPPENIYSEICSEVPRPEHVSVVRSTPGEDYTADPPARVHSSIVNGGPGSTIRISVMANSPPQSLDTVFAGASISSPVRDNTFTMDNIYNTLQ